MFVNKLLKIKKNINQNTKTEIHLQTAIKDSITNLFNNKFLILLVLILLY